MIQTMEESRKVFAQRLRDARERLRGLTQAQLAEKTGLPSTSISHFENLEGTRKPSFGNLLRLANALEVTTDYLLGRSNDHVGMPVAEEDMNIEWISIKNTMPEIGTEVIVYRPKFYTRPKLVTGHLIKSNDELCWNNDCEDNYFEFSDVSHWMPLFKFPEDEKEKDV